MIEGILDFDGKSEKYEFVYDGGRRELACGSLLEVWDGEEWLSCKVEYDKKWSGGYFLIVLRDGKENGSIPLWDKKEARCKVCR